MPLKAFRIVTEPGPNARRVLEAANPGHRIRQVEAIVHASARVHAVRHLNDAGLRVTLNELTRFGTLTSNTETLAKLAQVSCGTVIARPTNLSNAEYVELPRPEGIAG